MQFSGCYLHGFLFVRGATTDYHWAGSQVGESASIDQLDNIAINRISGVCHKYLDMDKIDKLLTD